MGPSGQDAPRARARIARSCGGSRPRGRAQERRSGGGHRPASRSRSLSKLRGGRMGYVPQRPVHRARHQGDRRLYVRALADRARVRNEDRPLARPPGRAARTHDSRDQGVGAGGRGRPTCLLGAADRARDRCWTDRSSCCPHRKATRARGPRPGPGRIGVQAGARSRPGGDLPHRHRRGRGLRAGRDRRMHRRRTAHRGLDPGRRAGRGRVSHGRRERRAHRWAPDGRRGVQPSAAQQRRGRQRQRQQAALVQGGRGTGACGPHVALHASSRGASHRRTS